jgi:hypothetical protein
MSLLVFLVIIFILFGGGLGWYGGRSGWGYGASWSPLGIILLLVALFWLSGGFR